MTTLNNKPVLFWANILKEDGCWLWQGKINSYGYGFCYWNGKKQTCHRLAYELTYGEIRPGLCICHKCDNRLCCNPSHLFAGTIQENIADMVAKGRQIKGPKVNRCKIPFEDILKMRELFKTKRYTLDQLGEMFNCTGEHVRYVVKNKVRVEC